MFPNLLVNGSADIPPHNLAEVVEAATALLARPDASDEELLELLRGPDYPSGGVLDTHQLAQIYTSGRGVMHLRGRWNLVRHHRGFRLVITALPYGVGPAQLVTAIRELAVAGALPWVRDVENRSAEEAITVVVELDKQAPVDRVLAVLVERTPLQVAMPVDVVVSHQGRVEQMSVLALLRRWLELQVRAATVRDRATARPGVARALEAHAEQFGRARQTALTG